MAPCRGSTFHAPQATLGLPAAHIKPSKLRANAPLREPQVRFSIHRRVRNGIGEGIHSVPCWGLIGGGTLMIVY
jgi:hypothetical protein